MPNSYNILIVAGEPSGDMHGALLVNEMKKIAPDIKFWGFGGNKMAQQNVEIIVDVENLAVMGLIDVIRDFPRLNRYMRELVKIAVGEKPAGAILIDYPGFNLKLAKKLKAQNIPVGYYISPQLWAWGEKRVNTIRKYVDKMVCILPFEKEFYNRHNIDVEYVGHPFVNIVKQELSRKQFMERTGVRGEYIVVLPGSRKKEIVRLLPAMLKTYNLINAKVKNISAVIAASSGYENLIAKICSKYSMSHIPIVENLTYSALSYAKAGIITSGSATLEALICELPAVVIYRVDAITWAIGKKMIKSPHIALANLVCGERVYPEFIQDFSSEQLADAIIELIEPAHSESKRENMKKKLCKAKEKLGDGDAPKKAATIFQNLFFGSKR